MNIVQTYRCNNIFLFLQQLDPYNHLLLDYIHIHTKLWCAFMYVAGQLIKIIYLNFTVEIPADMFTEHEILNT